MTLTLKDAIGSMREEQIRALYMSLPAIRDNIGFVLPDTLSGDVARLAIESVVQLRTLIENEVIDREMK